MQKGLCPSERIHPGGAYEIIQRLEQMKRNDLPEYLFHAVTKREKKKAQRHKLFEESFDAKRDKQ